MRIQGFQKLTLLDYPGKTAATVFTAGCNFRCPFCHNGSLVTDCDGGLDIPEEEILSVLRRRKGFLDGVCITGGEPLMWHDIGEFIDELKKEGFLVKLDTNGSYPDRLEALVSSGRIDYVAMDIKNAPDAYAETAGLKSIDISALEKSVDILTESGIPHEFRTTVTKEHHSVSRMESIGRWLPRDCSYFIQAYRLSDGVLDKTLTSPSREELESMLEAVRKYIPRAALRGID